MRDIVVLLDVKSGGEPFYAQEKGSKYLIQEAVYSKTVLDKLIDKDKVRRIGFEDDGTEGE